jgi:thiol-disulfide isomerase/thioredoxin
MTTLKERFLKWKETRSALQKAGDIFFWLLLILLLIPGPRKVISTAVNRVVMQVKAPGMLSPEKQVRLTDGDYAWELVDQQDNPVQVSSLKGNVIFLNFWATWCPPCVAELPGIQKLYKKHGESVVFLLVTDQEPSVVEAFTGKHGYDLPVFYARGMIPAAFQRRSIPTTYVISRDGRVVVSKTGAVNWDSKRTDRLLGELLK